METHYELFEDNFVRVNSPRSDDNVSCHPSFRRSEVLERIHRRINGLKWVVVWTVIWVVGVVRSLIAVCGIFWLTSLRIQFRSSLWIRNEWVPVSTPRSYTLELNVVDIVTVNR